MIIHTSKLIQYSTRPIGKSVWHSRISEIVFSRCETSDSGDRRKADNYMWNTKGAEKNFTTWITQLTAQKCRCPFSGWQEFAAKFDSCTQFTGSGKFNLGHYSHGRVLLEEFVGTADKLPATSPYLWSLPVNKYLHNHFATQMGRMLVYREGCDLKWRGVLCTRGRAIWINLRVINIMRTY